jgi:hypothetical protein
LGDSLTHSIDTLLRCLPKALARKLHRLSERTGETPIEILKRAVQIYETILNRKGPEAIKDTRKALAEVVKEPEVVDVFSGVMSQIAKRQSRSMTDDERKERARNAAQARWKDKEKGKPT